MSKRNPDSSLNHLYYIYGWNATKREYIFELTLEQFREITQSTCFYCGREPEQAYSVSKYSIPYIYNGVDRRDNEIGYTYENSVACCWMCNKMKNKFSEAEFLEHVNRIHNFQKQGQQ